MVVSPNLQTVGSNMGDTVRRESEGANHGYSGKNRRGRECCNKWLLDEDAILNEYYSRVTGRNERGQERRRWSDIRELFRTENNIVI